MHFGECPKPVNKKIFQCNVFFLEFLLRRARVKFGNPTEKLKKNPREFLSNSLSLSPHDECKFGKKTDTTFVSCQKSLNTSLNTWN